MAPAGCQLTIRNIAYIKYNHNHGHITSLHTPAKTKLDASTFFAYFTWFGAFNKCRSNLRTRTTTLILVLLITRCKLDLNYARRNRHPQSHLCNTSCMSSVEQVSWTMSCKVSPGRFIPTYRKMQSTQEAIDNKSINAHNDHCVLLVQQIYI